MTDFKNVKHAWAIVQSFEKLPDDDPTLMLDENIGTNLL